MVEQKVYTPAFRRMVAKAYYTSNNPMLRLARNSIPVLPMSAAGPGFIGMNFWESCPFVRKVLPLMRYPTSARP